MDCDLSLLPTRYTTGSHRLPTLELEPGTGREESIESWLKGLCAVGGSKDSVSGALIMEMGLSVLCQYSSELMHWLGWWHMQTCKALKEGLYYGGIPFFYPFCSSSSTNNTGTKRTRCHLRICMYVGGFLGRFLVMCLRVILSSFFTSHTKVVLSRQPTFWLYHSCYRPFKKQPTYVYFSSSKICTFEWWV